MSRINPRLPFSLLLIAVIAATTACVDPGGRDTAAPAGPLRVVATTGMIADTAARIVGEHGTVNGLMGPGVDPHLYKASESDVRLLSDADLILYNGLFLEGKIGDILVKLARSRPVVAVSELIPEEMRREPPEFQGHYDPHIWFDVSLWIQTLGPVTDALVELRPEHEASFRSHADQLRAELEQLDSWVQGRIQEIPEEHRVMVTAHDAFGYFGERYGIEVVGIQGISTLAEAGLQDVQRVVDLVVERGISALFVESSVPRRTVEAVVAAARERGHEVMIGGELFSDAMGAAGTEEGTYPGMVRHNVNTVVDALTGNTGAPDHDS
ncbi:MAG: zinc ABC transporter substrate-binding protein [Thermoanaerobaculia bacterium]|nr:zinc ABC transporter substrate-binding protein [Thermoanaerobaculia bacterium]